MRGGAARGPAQPLSGVVRAAGQVAGGKGHACHLVRSCHALRSCHAVRRSRRRRLKVYTPDAGHPVAGRSRQFQALSVSEDGNFGSCRFRRMADSVDASFGRRQFRRVPVSEGASFGRWQTQTIPLRMMASSQSDSLRGGRFQAMRRGRQIFCPFRGALICVRGVENIEIERGQAGVSLG